MPRFRNCEGPYSKRLPPVFFTRSHETAKKEKEENLGSEQGAGKRSLELEERKFHPSNLTLHIWSEATSCYCLPNFSVTHLASFLFFATSRANCPCARLPEDPHSILWLQQNSSCNRQESLPSPGLPHYRWRPATRRPTGVLSTPLIRPQPPRREIPSRVRPWAAGR